jgi:hypothetical protein
MKKLSGHGSGKGMTSISTSVDVKISQEINRLASASGITRGAWCRAALSHCADQKALFKIEKKTLFQKLGP